MIAEDAAVVGSGVTSAPLPPYSCAVPELLYIIIYIYNRLNENANPPRFRYYYKLKLRYSI